jgi:hypothetical protein
MKKTILIFILISLSTICSAQVIISGYVADSISGEKLIGANIFELKSKRGISTNVYGFYSLSLPGSADSVKLTISYVGYKSKSVIVSATTNQRLDIALNLQAVLPEVEIKAQRSLKSNTTEISTLELPLSNIKLLPSLMGETDLFRIFQLMPGVQAGREGTSGLFVRGGSPDQNLVLLDDIPLYYVNHVGGFISVFIPEAINSVKLYKGGFPARYQGRLSAIVDARMKDGNMSARHGNFTFGLLSSKLTLEGPFKDKKTTYLFSARRSMFDLLTRGFSLMSSGFKNSFGYTIYDFNGKISRRIDAKNRVNFSLYSGHDRIFSRGKNDENDDPNSMNKVKSKNYTQWGNTCAAIRWNHIINDRLISNYTFGYTTFYLTLKSKAELIVKANEHTSGTYKDKFKSNVNDLLIKSDFDYFLSSSHTIKFGGNMTQHFFKPASRTISFHADSLDNYDTSYYSQHIKGLETNFYVEDEFTINKKLMLNMGITLATLLTDKKIFPSVQPRLSINYKLAEYFSLKTSYSRMTQFMHMLSNSDGGLPTDIWVPATRKAVPENASQYVVGMAWYPLKSNVLEVTAEGFYKTMTNLIDYSDGGSIFDGGTLNWESVIETNGSGKAYGMELMVQKSEGKTTGWIAYTLSKNTRQFENINSGNPYAYKYDRTHDFSIVATHRFNESFTMSGTWVYSTGNPVTLATTQYQLNNMGEYNSFNSSLRYQQIFVYGKRNNYRLRDYHRLDLSFNFTRPRKKGMETFSIELYNVYNRMNTFALFYEKDRKTGEIKLYSLTLFPFLPSFSWSYNF